MEMKCAKDECSECKATQEYEAKKKEEKTRSNQGAIGCIDYEGLHG